jgi:hypothetical protein
VNIDGTVDIQIKCEGVKRKIIDCGFHEPSVAASRDNQQIQGENERCGRLGKFGTGRSDRAESLRCISDPDGLWNRFGTEELGRRNRMGYGEQKTAD